MGDWFYENASAIIPAASALSGAILAAVSSFIVTLLNHKANKSQRNDSFSHERWKLNRDLYLSKAEEILMLFNKWSLFVLKEHNAQLADCYFEQGMGEFYDSTEHTDIENLKPKIYLLLAIYYSELVPDFELIVDASERLRKDYIETLTNTDTRDSFKELAQENIKSLSESCGGFIISLARSSKTHM
ncbi:hypothetical protein NRB41_004905 [Salmonella enterica]|nr:hypothetical protein [Salmonella enterica]ECE0052085.1 hypothetical protein [Salmonella enterica subsp. enterica]EAQ3181496.1 hypothetical protein [Salmonella enterica]EAV4625496.1 hypothetical protein [Salmonella enterica]EBT6740098.1 hypothetical protein [Salmonella enterica]